MKGPFKGEVLHWHFYEDWSPERAAHGWVCNPLCEAALGLWGAGPAGSAAVGSGAVATALSEAPLVFPSLLFHLWKKEFNTDSSTFPDLCSEKSSQMRNIFQKDSELGLLIWYCRDHVRLCGTVQLNYFFLKNKTKQNETNKQKTLKLNRLVKCF